MNLKPIIFAVLLTFLLLPVYAQDKPKDAAKAADGSELPKQFRQLSLGMGLDALKDELIKDELFQFRGDRDVSFLPAREQSLVETTGLSFIKRAFFQLRDGKFL